MKKALIIVESPAKVKTLRKFLGDDYLFESSVGHIRDLPSKGFGIDVENDFEPVYETLAEKKDVIKDLVKASKKAEMVYLCPDPDREGEAIAWHISEILPKGTKFQRATFFSITKKEVERALSEPTDINYSLVDAQQARRLLDRIVGYKISPILARRVQGGRRSDGSLSAGRVQSIALKLVVDREKEIEAFKPLEYWVLTAQLRKGDAPLSATLFSIDGEKVEKESVPNEARALELKSRLEKGSYSVEKVERKEKKRHPVAPFITSTMQQEASRHYGFSAARTMNIAQGLYEGIDMGKEGTEGLITYMRTDSIRSAPEAVMALRDLIKAKYGDEYLPKSPRMFKSKKSAQDAHEAIRPTNLDHPPEKIKSYLTIEQFKLYSLIWKRFVSSQMASAIYDTVSADIACDGLTLRATGSVIKFPGFLKLYQEKKEEEEKEDDEKLLPHIDEGDKLDLKEVAADQKFTKPPPRYSEASLVRELEKCGVGRPSTYAAIMQKIQRREYTVKESGRLKPTELGQVCAMMLEQNFPIVMNIDFTAHMEDDLEEIAEGKREWKELVRTFWKDFIPVVEKAEEEAFVPRIDTQTPCPKCGKHLQKIWSRSKYFYGCSGYPDCDYSAPIEELTFDKSEYDPNFDWEQPCPICEGEMKVRHGRYGAFMGCLKYPECKGTVNIPKKGETDLPQGELPACPAKGCDGKMTMRRSRYGKIFFSCTTFPDCDVIVNKLDDLHEKYPDHPKTAYVRKTRKKAAPKKKKKAAPKKPRKVSKRALSPEMANLLGEKEMTRGDVLKGIWAYIKANNLQDENNKRIIVPDDKLAALFGSPEPIDMFKLAGIVSKHLK